MYGLEDERTSPLLESSDDVGVAIARLDRWLESMRGDGGYTGPVSHWWASSLLYCGPMIDWRYEGIICGYLTLAERLGGDPWLARAMAAAADAVAAQLPDGRFARSSFQVGPMEGGTPHEAAVDIGLFAAAAASRASSPDRAARFVEAAVKNVELYQLGRLWDGSGFRDQPGSATRVANKNATTIDALIGYHMETGADIEPYVAGAVGVIESAFVDGESRDVRAGGTIHLGTGPFRLVVPFYTARCIGALVSVDALAPDPRYRRLGSRMAEFLVRSYERDGFVFGYAGDGRVIANPSWIAAAGEILRALVLADGRWTLGLSAVVDRVLADVLSRQRANGSWATAEGFARRGSARPYRGRADLRDVLPVVGWNDKVLRALALCLRSVSASFPTVSHHPRTVIEPCTWKGRHCLFREDDASFSLVETSGGAAIYEWKKGAAFPCCYRL
jgi:hypothetical protein